MMKDRFDQEETTERDLATSLGRKKLDLFFQDYLLKKSFNLSQKRSFRETTLSLF
jgi:hypothetical protein